VGIIFFSLVRLFILFSPLPLRLVPGQCYTFFSLLAPPPQVVVSLPLSSGNFSWQAVIMLSSSFSPPLFKTPYLWRPIHTRCASCSPPSSPMSADLAPHFFNYPLFFFLFVRFLSFPPPTMVSTFLMVEEDPIVFMSHLPPD